MYLPLYNGSERKYIIRVPARLCFLTVSTPLVAFVICVLLTIYKDSEKANNTHCKVPNVLPSISASIGNFEPQSSIWKTAIYVHSPIRFYIVYLRWQYYKTVISENCEVVVNLAVILNIIENLALIGLTYWTSSGNYPYHEVCFKLFIATSVFYMLFICILLTNNRRRPNISFRERHSVRLKWRAFIVNVASFACAAYFFLRHNRLCEPYGKWLFHL
ncbi:hypothetical protein O3G_MSEX011259 [Manduca sexta]|uniref:CWH43-like N-terminal domain-containing protein n=1 Tax=Manduca sexta TaxID=7130 RepID=A0A922CTU4_MANSE|nr:hypothetical protein O3G_MSEX011259 [Manduca sexta]